LSSSDEKIHDSAHFHFAASRHVPFLEHLEIEPVDACDGYAEFRMTVKEHHLRTLGLLHGGVVATLLDTAMGFASITRAPHGHHVVTIQLNMNFIRAAYEDEILTAKGTVIHSGRKTAVLKGEVSNQDGETVAIGTSTFMYLPFPDEHKHTTAGVSRD